VPSTDQVVTDILGPAPEEGESDEALDTLDMGEAVATKEPAGVEAGVQPQPGAAVTDERETVAVPAADETKAALGGEETRGTVTEAGEAVETGGAVAAAVEEQAGEEEPEAPAVIPTGWEAVQSWPAGNVLLIAATVVLIIAGALLFCEAFGIHNSLTAAVAKAVVGHSH
jgi:hypothetical protein